VEEIQGITNPEGGEG